MIVDEYRNQVVSGAHQREYEDTIEHVEYFAFNHLPSRAKTAQTAEERAK
jgi:hypothetical protein